MVYNWLPRVQQTTSNSDEVRGRDDGGARDFRQADNRLCLSLQEFGFVYQLKKIRQVNNLLPIQATPGKACSDISNHVVMTFGFR